MMCAAFTHKAELRSPDDPNAKARWWPASDHRESIKTRLLTQRFQELKGMACQKIDGLLAEWKDTAGGTRRLSFNNKVITLQPD